MKICHDRLISCDVAKLLIANLVVANLLVTMTRPADADWPMWRGPAANGRSSSEAAPTHWSPTTNIAWRTAIPGVGYSSPIVSGNHIFLTSADLDTKERILFCIDREGGDIRWQRTVVTAEIEQMHRSNSPASGTPATDGQLVYVAFQANETILVAAYDDAGNLIWQKSPGGFKSRHGFHTCPILFEDSILVSGMQDSTDAFLVRMRRADGEFVWKARIDSPIRSFSSPLVINVEGQQQIVLAGANRTYAFDASSGRPIWSVHGPAEKTVSSLSFDGKHVFVPGGRDSQLFAIRPTGTGDVTKSHISWIARKGIPYISSPLLLENHLHVVSDEGVYTRIDIREGATVSQKRLVSKASSSPVFVAGHIYITGEDGETVVLTPAGEILARNELGEEVYASLAISGNDIFIRGAEHLYKVHDADE